MRAVELFVKYQKVVEESGKELDALREELVEVGDEEALEAFDDEESQYAKVLFSSR